MPTCSCRRKPQMLWKKTEYCTKTIDNDSAIHSKKHFARSVDSFFSLAGTKMHPGLLEILTHSTQKKNRMSKIYSDNLCQNARISPEPFYIAETEEETCQQNLIEAELYGKIKTFISFFNIWQSSPCSLFTSLGKSGSSKRQQGSLCKSVLLAERSACSRYRLKKYRTIWSLSLALTKVNVQCKNLSTNILSEV